MVSGRFSDDFRLGSPFGFVEPPTTLAVDVQRRFRPLVAARRLEAPEPQPMRPPFPSRRSLANVSPIGLSTRRRVDDMDGRRRVVPEGSAFAAANGFEKPRRPARRLLRTSGGNFMDASNHGLCGFLGKFTVRFCCYYRCSLLRVWSSMRSRLRCSRHAAARADLRLAGSDGRERLLGFSADDGPSGRRFEDDVD